MRVRPEWLREWAGVAVLAAGGLLAGLGAGGCEEDKGPAATGTGGTATTTSGEGGLAGSGGTGGQTTAMGGGTSTATGGTGGTGGVGAGGMETGGMGGAGMGGSGMGGSGMGGSGGGTVVSAVPGFSLVDVNPASTTYNQPVSPGDYLGKVSAWYFGHST